MTISMGLGTLAQPEMVFVRKFRFLLYGPHLTSDFIYSVDIDWTSKRLYISSYEVLKEDRTIEIHEWANAMEANEYPDEYLTLITADGCGNEIYRRKFNGLSVIRRFNSFGYNDSNAALHEIILTYSSHEFLEIDAETHHAVCTKKNEAQIDHLNGRMFIM